MNMLSIGAAYGVLVAVFQWGWLGSLIGIEPGPIEPFMPMMLFAVLFGLSMDYEVFLLSRMKEEYERTGDAVNSVADGLAATARVITAAALIMVFVFGSFVFEDQRAIKMFGLGPRRRGSGRRQPGAHADRSVHHGAARGSQLVAAGLAGSDPAQPQRGGQPADLSRASRRLGAGGQAARRGHRPGKSRLGIMQWTPLTSFTT